MADEKSSEDMKLLESPKDNDNAKRDFYIELALFLILGILIGIAVKTEAAKKITIGFDDYKMKNGARQYSINKLQMELINKQVEAAEKQESGQDSALGQTCVVNQ